jgi:hypothetical protein
MLGQQLSELIMHLIGCWTSAAMHQADLLNGVSGVHGSLPCGAVFLHS